MAESTKNAAGTTNEMARNRLKWILITAAFVILLVVLAWSISLIKTWPALLISAVSIFIVFKTAHIFTDRLVDRYHDARRGAKAEETVATVLDLLGCDYRIFHDVESKHGNIDHLLIRKDGAIIVIETKSHECGVKFVGDELRRGNGEPFEKDFIRQAHSLVYEMRDYVSENVDEKPWVSGIIVFTKSFVKNRPPVRGITVCNVKFMLRAISKARPNPAYAQMLWDQWQISAAKLN